MKMKHRALALLLSMMMVLAFMPAMAFAAGGESFPTKIKYMGDTTYETAENPDDIYFDGFWNVGSEIDVTWSDGKTEKYVVKEYDRHDEKGNLESSVGYFLESDTPHVVKDEDGYESADNDVYGLGFSIDSNGNITVSYEYEYYDEASEDWVVKTVKDTFKGRTPKSLSYSGPKLAYDAWEEEKWVDCYQEGAKITVTYSDGSTRTAVCKKYATEKDGTGDSYPLLDYFFEGVEPEVVTDPEGGKYARNSAGFYFDNEKMTTKSIPVEHMGLKTTLPVSKKSVKWALRSGATRFVGDPNGWVNVYDKNSVFGVEGKVKSVKSSKSSVLKVQKVPVYYDNGKKATQYYVDARKTGKAKLTIKFTDPKGKSHTLKKTITVKKYPNEIKSLKVNGKKVNVKKNKYFFTKKTSSTSVKVKMALKSGWKIKSVESWKYKKSGNATNIKVTKKMVQNGSKISFPKKYKGLEVYVTMAKGSDTITYSVSFQH
jgi:putative transposon-encoded protein